MPDFSLFSIHRIHAGCWTITFSDPPINIFTPATLNFGRYLPAFRRADDEPDTRPD